MLSKSTAGRNAVPREGNKRFSRGLREFSRIVFKNPRQSAKPVLSMSKYLRQMGLKTPCFFGAKRSSSTTVPETLRSTQGDNLKGELRKVSNQDFFAGTFGTVL
jgi:hypothetical protein